MAGCEALSQLSFALVAVWVVKGLGCSPTLVVPWYLHGLGYMSTHLSLLWLGCPYSGWTMGRVHILVTVKDRHHKPTDASWLKENQKWVSLSLYAAIQDEIAKVTLPSASAPDKVPAGFYLSGSCLKLVNGSLSFMA